jgi:hypothetical protein
MALKVTIRTKSGRPLKQTLSKFERNVMMAGEKEILREAVEIRALAIPLTPFKFGPLRASGRVEGPFRRGKTTSVFVAFGNNSGVHYAWIRHEIEAEKYTTAGTGTKYLTRPFQGRKPGMAKRVQSGIRKRVGSRGINVI